MNLIYEENSRTGRTSFARRVNGVTEVPESGGDSGKGHEAGRGRKGGSEGTGEGSLTGTRRAPEDYGGEELVRRGPEERVRPKEMVLAKDGVEGRRPHPLGERGKVRSLWTGRRDLGFGWRGTISIFCSYVYSRCLRRSLFI